jgi:V/A-type H+-transporting ATPase subunit I
MAIVPMQKISLFVHKKDKPKVVDFLQDKGVLHITDTAIDKKDLEELDMDDETRDLQYIVARLDFACTFLAKFEEKKKGLQAKIDGKSVKVDDDKEIEKIADKFQFNEVVDRCKSVEEEMVHLNNEIKDINNLQKTFNCWTHLQMSLDIPHETENAVLQFISVPLEEWEILKTELLNLSKLVDVGFDNTIEDQVYVQVVCDRSVIDNVDSVIASHKAEVIEIPELSGSIKEELKKLDNRLAKIDERLGQLTEAAEKLSIDLKKLRICYDYYNWRLLRKQARQSFVATESTILLSGWMPKEGVKDIEIDLVKDVTKNFELMEIEPEEGEDPPVLLKNSGILGPFQTITNLYGLPGPKEIDPTPFMAAFFIGFYGLALTDAVYGLLLFAIMFSVLKYLKIPKKSQGLIRLLMYAGIVTFILGIVFGGWAGLTIEQAPAFLKSTTADGETVFIGQKMSALTNPLGVLILALTLGFIQVLLGVYMKFVWMLKKVGVKEAFLGQFPWAYMLTIIGFTILIYAGILPESLMGFAKILLYIGAAYIVLTHGREKKNIILKFLSGVLGLYNLVSYFADVLSYSRLLALGLSTSIIALAVNTVAGLLVGIPYIGIVIALLIIIGGHIFTIVINAFGAFIHSARLQFVEFFTKFLEGGGKPFKPLYKESKFVRYETD